MDPIALAASAIWATMVSVLLFLLPGWALGPAILPGAPGPLERWGRAAGVSLVATLVLCTVLAWLGVLSASSVLLGCLALTLAGALIVRPRPRRLGRRAIRWWAAGAVAIGLGLVLVIVPSRQAVGADLLPLSSTTWYYLDLAQSIADLGAIPATSPEWGADRPFQTDYLPVSAHTAAALLTLPGGSLVVTEVYRLVILALALLFATLLFRRWVSVWAAALGAILLLSTVRLDAKFDGYRPETVALALALFALWVADRALVERSPRTAGVALLSISLVFLSHAEVFLILAPALIGMGLARAVVRPGRTPGRIGFRAPFPVGRLRPLVLAVGLVLGGMLLGALGGVALTGESRVLGYVTGGGAGAAVDPEPGEPGEVPVGWTFSGDPTWDFYTASVAPALNGQPPPDAFTDTLLLPRSILHIWPGLDGRFRSGLAVLAALVVLPLLAWPWLDPRRRRMVLAWFGFGLMLVAGSFLLFTLSDTYVPQRTGGRRLMPYLLFVPVMAATLGLWIVGRLAAPAWRSLLPGRGRALAAGTALALLTVGAVSASPLPSGGDGEPDPALTQTGYDAYRWMAAELSPDARILANAYTDGAVAAVAERMGIVDGRAVYLEDRAFLAESTALALGARVVFGTPSAPGAATYLDREGVTHLLVATAGPGGNDLGGYLLFDTDVEAIQADPRFRLVESFGDGRLLLFEVTPAVAAIPAHRAG